MQSGMMLAIVGTFLFALKSILIKLAYADGANATELLSLRMLLSAPFYIAVLLLMRGRAMRLGSMSADPPVSTSQVASAWMLGFLGYYLASYLDMCGLQLISAQLERLTLFTYPTLIAVMAALFLKERLTLRIVLSLLLCYVGIWIMYCQERELTGGSQVGLGVLFVLGSAVSYSAYIVLAKQHIARMGSREFTCWAMLGSAFFVMMHFAISENPSRLLEQPRLWIYGLLLAFICTVIPSFLINEAVARIGATRTSIVGSVGPVMTMLLAVLVLGEPTSGAHFSGMLLVVFGVALVGK